MCIAASGQVVFTLQRLEGKQWPMEQSVAYHYIISCESVSVPFSGPASLIESARIRSFQSE